MLGRILLVLRRLALRLLLLLLTLLLLFLLQLLLLLPVFLLELLKLLLLLLLDLLPSSVLSVFLLNPLLLLDLPLLDLLAFLVLFLAELFQLLLVPLIKLRVHGGRRIGVPATRPSVRRTIVIGLFPDVGCGRIPRPIALWLLACVVGCRRLVRIISHIGRRLAGIAASRGLVRIILPGRLRWRRVIV